MSNVTTEGFWYLHRELHEKEKRIEILEQKVEYLLYKLNDLYMSTYNGRLDYKSMWKSNDES